jgi:hypothetical protein
MTWRMSWWRRWIAFRLTLLRSVRSLAGVRCVAANLHPDRDTIAAFRRANRAAFEAAFLAVLLLARGSGLLRVCLETPSI